MKKTQALLILSLSTTLFACGGGVDQPKPIVPSPAPSSVAASSVAPSSVAASSVAPSSIAPSSVAASSSSPAATLSKVAKIFDANPGDTGELRFVIPGDDLLQGKLTLSFLKDPDLTDSAGVEKNAYITLFNSTNSTSSGRAILDLLIGSAFTIRDQAGITVNTPLKPGVWQTIEITWDYAGTAQATVTIVIDGDTANALSYPASSTAIGGVSAVAFRLADNSAVITSDKAFFVDDVKLYSNKAGTTSVLEDNFESYAVTTDLSGAAIRDTGLTYDSSTSDVRVVELAK